MKQKLGKKLTAVGLRWLLLGAILIIVGLGVATFYFGSKLLSQRALEADHAKTEAIIASDAYSRLQKLKAQLQLEAIAVERASQIVAEIERYQYQDQIVEDLEAFAARAGVKVIGFDFGAPESVTSTTQPGSVISGVKSRQATITLQTPIGFTSFMRFIKAIEQNLTKMQVSGLAITPDAENPNIVNNSTITLTVYVKE